MAGRAGRAIGAPLGTTSLIDLLMVLVVFLLIAAPPSQPECGCSTRPVGVPWAQNTEDMIDAPLVQSSGGVVLVDGVSAGSVRESAEIGRITPIPELMAILKNKRELWKLVQPNKPFPGVCILQIDQGAPALAVKSLFMSAAWSGYPNVSFMVRKIDK